MPEPKIESKIGAGQVLVGKYRVTREIGRGGMAAVYEAEHLTLGKKVAVKILAAELAASTIVIERFFREARAASSVKSSNIVDIYDSGRLEDGRPFIAMEMLEGETLYDRMTRIRLIDPATTVRILTQCAKGLMKAHAVGIVHRDLKPENIFILKAEDGEELIKILDFGLAKFYEPVKTDEKTARLTREGAVFGTPAYMSPEQVKGQGNVDHRADLWALGCMAFECLTGRPVWNTEQGVAMTFASIAAPVPSRLRPDLPLAFDEWFKKALERDPAKRFQTAKELAEALGRVFGGGPVSVVSGHDLERGDTVSMKGPPDGMSGIGSSERDDSHRAAMRQESMPGSRSAPVLPMDPRSAPALPQPSAPIPLVQQPAAPSPARDVALSAVDLPPTARASRITPPAPRPGAMRYLVSAAALTMSLGAVFWAWAKVLSPQIYAPIVRSTAVLPTATGSARGIVADPSAVAVGEAKWAGAIADAQKSFAEGDAQAAQRKLKDAQDQGAPAGIVRSFQEQMGVGAAGAGPCRMAAFAHPRLGLTGSAHLPSVAIGPKGPIVAWTDDHEVTGHEHVYDVMLDATGHATSRPRDLTPEASDVGSGSLLGAGDRVLLLYWDKSGREAGIRVRWIDENGRIGGDSVVVGAARAGSYWPAIERAPDGFYVAWQDDRDGSGDELYLRHLGQQAEPLGNEIRATDYAGPAKRPPVVKNASVAVASNALYVTYELDRDTKQHLIQRLRVPLGSPELASGLDPKGAHAGAHKDRQLGDVQVVNEDKAPSSLPAIACGSEGCFLAWHGEQGGASVALIDPVVGRVMWRKSLAAKGSHPALAASASAQVMVAYFEAGKIKLATLTRDGVGVPSVIAKVSGDQPRPWLSSARQGEWFIAWQDTEERHSEVYAARVVCK